MWRPRPPTARRSCSRSTERTSRPRSQQDWDVDVLEGADVVASARVVQQRLAPVPMETNAIAVVPEDDGGYTIWCSTQVPFDVRSDLAELLEVDKKQVRIVAPDVGRRVRREAARLSGVRGRGGGREGARPSGAVGRDAVGEHAEPQPRPGAGAARGDRRQARRHRRRHARGDPRRHGRVPDRRVPAHHDAGDAVRRLRDPADRVARMERGHEHDAGVGVSRGGPPGGDGPRRARDGSDRGRAGDGSRRRPAEEPDPGRRVPVHDRVGHHRTTSGTTSARSTRRCGSRACRSSARSRRRAGRAATTCCWASGCARTSRSRRSRRRSSGRSRCTTTAR